MHGAHVAPCGQDNLEGAPALLANLALEFIATRMIDVARRDTPADNLLLPADGAHAGEPRPIIAPDLECDLLRASALAVRFYSVFTDLGPRFDVSRPGNCAVACAGNGVVSGSRYGAPFPPRRRCSPAVWPTVRSAPA